MNRRIVTRAEQPENDIASELLAALEGIIDYAEAHVTRVNALSAGSLYPNIRIAALERARAAIKKAKGE